MSVLRREQVVAASLVGTVVVLVGFASGLGITHPAADSVTTSGPAAATGSAPSSQAGGDGSNGGGGVNYVGVAEPGAGYSGGGGSVGLGGDYPVTTTGPLPTSDYPTTTTTAPTTTPGASCQPGVVPLAVTSAVNGVAGVAGNLPVVGSLFGGGTETTTTTAAGLAGIVNGLTTPLLGSCTTPTPATTPTVTTTPGGGS